MYEGTSGAGKGEAAERAAEAEKDAAAEGATGGSPAGPASYEGFHELVRASRTYRRFSGEQVGEEVLRELVDAARLAPSGNNLQVLRLAVTNDPETVALLARHHGWAGALKDFEGPAEGELPGAYVGILCPEASAASPLRNVDAGIMAQTLCLAACAKGLGTCMIKSYDKEAAGILGVPDGYQLVLLVALGRPAADERVVLEPATTEHGLRYWRTASNVHHVPKLGVDDLLV
ncbi:MAG: nitroreductase family protein [Olsenella sp.]|nr:nitroreductase family protein [Olsenella sp.]